MNFFYWNKSFEIGVPSIDVQHRRLVDLINALAAAITEGGRLPDVQSLFGQLMEYAAVHFSDEEKLMDDCPLPEEDKEQHRRAHRGFVEKAQQLMRSPDLLQADVAEQVLEFLITWLISHILGSDRKIASALASGVQSGDSETTLLGISQVERVLLGALTETERRFRLISDHTPAMLWVSDANGERGFFNRAWTDFVGLDAESTGAMDWRAFIHPDDRDAYLSMLERLPRTRQPSDAEYRLLKHNGQYHWFFEKILPRIDSGNVFMGLIASATDISSIKQAEALLNHANQELEQEVARRTAQLEHLMLTDALTGVGNRRMLTTRLAAEALRAQRYQRPFSAIFVDLDHFKHINDTYGHAGGDAVLVAICTTLGACMRECDLLGRFGGDEFVALLPETGIDAALSVGNRMRSEIAQLQLRQVPETVTISVGVVEWTSGESDEDLLRRADRAMYRAKNEGRNCCRTDSDD